MTNGTGTPPDGVGTNGAADANGSLALPVLDPKDAPRLEPTVRERVVLWDRLKILVLLVALWWVLFWAASTTNPIESFEDLFRQELRSLLWLEVVIGLEVLRQLHYLWSERSPRWYRLWTVGVFGGLNRLASRVDDWNRFRIARALRIILFLAILAVILAAFFHTSPAISLFEVPAALYGALPFILQIIFAFLFGAVQIFGIFWLMSRGGVDVYYPGDVKSRFSDVWGQDAVLDRVKENIIFLKDPEAIESRGGYVPGGILLWGPPGTGKTLIAEAVAGETHNPFVFVDPGAFINMFFGVGILKVKSLFRKLRRLALRYGGVVVFFDEADSLGNRGALTTGGIFGPRAAPAPAMFSAPSTCHGFGYLGPGSSYQLASAMAPATAAAPPETGRVFKVMGMGMNGGGGMGTLQSLLSEIQGLNKPRGLFNRTVRRVLGMKPKPPPKYRILIMMATNMPQSLDEALLRPGRIDRIYKVGYPSKAGRIRTYEGYFSKVANDLTPEQVDRLATMTPYATGATIKDLVNESLINSIREGRELITWADVLRAKQLKELGPPEDVEYIRRERHSVAIHEACHAVAAARLPKDWAIDVATIEKGADYLGMVKPVRAEDTFTQWRSDYESDIMVSLASLAGERMFFDGDSASGVSSDLSNATLVAAYMEGFWGMGQTIASHEATQLVGIGGGAPGGRAGRDRDTSDKDLFAVSLGSRIEAKLADLLARTQALLEENRFEVLAVAHALEAHKTVAGEDVLAIVRGTKGTFIDGRRYHTQAFRDAAEAYHAAVLAAHKARVQVDFPLPELPPAIGSEDGATQSEAFLGE